MIVERLRGGSLDDGQILSRFWQQSPVILEQAVDTSTLVPDTETLIQILTETGMPSRLVTGVEGLTFTIEQGPFDHFHPPKKPWSVLIHALEHLFPEYDHIRKSIQWIPHWRFEDCMLSWASVGGSVGRHFDEFSVFLIQLNGRRTWEIGPAATVDIPTVRDQPIALVQPLDPWTSWTAHPGDVLYLPPKMIHHGVSLDQDCMTLSIGFRAPDAGVLLEGAVETLDRQSNIPRFNDAGRQHHGQPAEILANDLLEAKAAMIRYLEQPEVLEHLLATRVTTPYLDLDMRQGVSGEDIDQQIESVTQWELDPGCRMAYVNQTLYINGERIGDQTPSELLQLANTRAIQSADIRRLNGFWLNTIIELIRTESLLPLEDDGS